MGGLCAHCDGCLEHWIWVLHGEHFSGGKRWKAVGSASM
jgi:hypothetical protein